MRVTVGAYFPQIFESKHSGIFAVIYQYLMVIIPEHLRYYLQWTLQDVIKYPTELTKITGLLNHVILETIFLHNVVMNMKWPI